MHGVWCTLVVVVHCGHLIIRGEQTVLPWLRILRWHISRTTKLTVVAGMYIYIHDFQSLPQTQFLSRALGLQKLLVLGRFISVLSQEYSCRSLLVVLRPHTVPQAPVYSYCDMGESGAKETGGWTVILRRRNSTFGLVNFNR